VAMRPRRRFTAKLTYSEMIAADSFLIILAVTS